LFNNYNNQINTNYNNNKMSEQVKIKRTTIERGVRLATGAAGDDGDLGGVKALAVAAIKQKRDHEKQVLHQLNDRFAKYIDRVKFLEGQNKKLLAELEELRNRWGEESRAIRDRYEPELLEARATIDDTTREKAIAEIKAKRSEYEASNLKRQYDDALGQVQVDKNKMANLQYLLQENQVELDLLRRQMHDAESDIEKYRREVSRLNEDLQRLLSDLDQETLRRVRLENEKQTLEEQIPFLNAIHEQEMAELRSLQAGSHIDPAQFYRHELERAIRDIRSDFEDLNEQQRRELEEWYKIKTEEITQQAAKRDALDSLMNSKQESSANLKVALSETQQDYHHLKQINADLIMRLSQIEEELDQVRRNNGLEIDQRDRDIAELRAKLQELMNDYDELMNNKTTLEFEINTYRRLLECEESRGTRVSSSAAAPDVSKFKYTTITTSTSSTALGQATSSPVTITANVQPVVVTQTQLPPGDFRLSASEMSSKTTFQRSAKGPVSISECSPDGKVIILENTSRNKDINMTGWVLKRRVDNKEELTYKFPANLVLKSNKTVRIWARGHGKENQPTDLVNSNVDNWGMGVNVVTIVLNDVGDEKATHLQKTVYAS
jgi:intermediate filament protein if